MAENTTKKAAPAPRPTNEPMRVKGRNGNVIGLGPNISPRTVAQRVNSGDWSPVNDRAKAANEEGKKMLRKLRRQQSAE